MIYDLRFTIYGFLKLKSYILNPIASAYLFLFSWFLIFLLPVVFSNEGIPHALRALPLLIPAIIFAAIGLEWIVVKIQQWLERKKREIPDRERQHARVKKELLTLLVVSFAAIAMHNLNQYFLRWSWNPYVSAAFNGSYANLGHYLADLPSATKKYVIVNTPGHMLADDIPMPAQTVMFFTDTWNKQKRNEKSFFYIPSVNDLSLLPQTLPFPAIITILENNPALRRELKARHPKLISKITNGGLVLTNVK